MASSSRMREAQLAADNFGLALSYLGFKSAVESDDLFAGMSSQGGEAGKRFVGAFGSLVLAQRGLAETLAIAYYRLLRALLVGETYSKPGGKAEDTTLGELREEFMDAVHDAVPDDRLKPTETTKGLHKRARLQESIKDLPSDDGGEKIPVEKFEWPREAAEDDARDIAEKRANGVVISLEERRKAKWEKFEKDSQDKLRQRAQGIAQKTTNDAGRKLVYLTATKDRKVIGYVRASRTGTPCYFCAMLISRGMVYKSKKVTRDGITREEHDLFHDNCNCYSQPVFSEGEYSQDERYNLNRELGKLWSEKIRGKFSGQDAINEWRKVIREWNAENRNREAAQEAA